MSFRSSLICTLLLISASPSALHAQELLHKQYNDAVLILGTNFTRTQDGVVTKIKYPPVTVERPGYGTYPEVEQYDFIDGACEALHYFIPVALKQKFIDSLNKKYGFSDEHLWVDDGKNHITIKEHDNNFDLMVWTPAYEKMLDSRY